MSNISLELDEIYNLAKNTFLKNGCDDETAAIMADLVTKAEKDGSLSHGLFRVPAYVSGLKSGKINGKGKPDIKIISASVVKANGNNCLAPVVLKKSIPELVKLAKESGVAILSITNSHHMAAMWPETETIAEQGLVAFACTSYKPAVAPAGAIKPLFGTNPISFAWPRKDSTPLVFDMATSTLAMGDVQIAARDGHPVPHGTGLGPDGKPSDDPKEILKGVLLPFGGYKGSAISMMIELFSAGLTGDNFSFEAAETDNNDGGPAKGGELVLAINPELIAGPDWNTHSEGFFDRIKQLRGIRLPGERRHRNRLDDSPRKINKELLEKIRGL